MNVLRPGTAVENFRILSLIGHGGMGSVYKAEQVPFNRFVALKFIKDSFATALAAKRFEREAQILATLTHKNLCTFYSFGRWQGKTLFLAVEFVPWQSLDQVLSAHGRLPWKEAFRLAIEICHGMYHVHKSGIIHRDLKPSNILVNWEDSGRVGGVKVADFGLAAFSDPAERQKLTGTGFTVGTSQYMSPEQCMAQTASEASDIYSLGCILFECLFGGPPFAGSSDFETMKEHLMAELVLPSTKDLPAGVTEVLDRALAKEANQRYTDMQEMAQAMERVLQHEANNEDRIIRLDVNQRPVARFRKKTTVAPVIACLALFFIACAAVAIFIDETHNQFTIDAAQALGEKGMQPIALFLANHAYTRAKARRDSIAQLEAQLVILDAIHRSDRDNQQTAKDRLFLLRDLEGLLQSNFSKTKNAKAANALAKRVLRVVDEQPLIVQDNLEANYFSDLINNHLLDEPTRIDLNTKFMSTLSNSPGGRHSKFYIDASLDLISLLLNQKRTTEAADQFALALPVYDSGISPSFADEKTFNKSIHVADQFANVLNHVCALSLLQAMHKSCADNAEELAQVTIRTSRIYAIQNKLASAKAILESTLAEIWRKQPKHLSDLFAQRALLYELESEARLSESKELNAIDQTLSNLPIRAAAARDTIQRARFEFGAADDRAGTAEFYELLLSRLRQSDPSYNEARAWCLYTILCCECNRKPLNRAGLREIASRCLEVLNHKMIDNQDLSRELSSKYSQAESLLAQPNK